MRPKIQAQKKSFRLLISLLLISFVTSIHAVPMVRINLTGTSANDETVIYYQAGATSGFDSQYDSYKLLGPNPSAYICQLTPAASLAINGISPVSQSFSIELLISTPLSGSYNISATDFSELPAGTVVNLYDKVTGSTCNLLNSNYLFESSSSEPVARFILTIVPPSSISSNTCVSIDKTKADKIIRIKKEIKVSRSGKYRFNIETSGYERKLLVAEMTKFLENAVEKTNLSCLDDDLCILDCSGVSPGLYLLKIRNNDELIQQMKILISE
jgi:hypothetical protein